MYPEIEKVGGGDYSICGMDLEPKPVGEVDPGDDETYADMKLRFSSGFVLSVPLVVIAMRPMVGLPVADWIDRTIFGWLKLVLAKPVVFWFGWPLLLPGAKSFHSLNLNMFTLITVGTLGVCTLITSWVFPWLWGSCIGASGGGSAP
jgi:Cu+-exporting ATPase